jgi:starvation-inducible outer membrane lipoprotein
MTEDDVRSYEDAVMAKMRFVQSLFVTALFVGAFFLSGCASPPPETSDPSSKEIKSDSDRAFEKMKQEEQERERARVREGTINPNPGSTR